MRFAFFLLALGCLVRVPAQTPAFLHYGVRDGLPGNIVYCGLQDRQGMLWFGTDKGLARFDGTRFQVFDMNDGLPDTEVLSLLADHRERLWVLCFQQKPCYRQYNGFRTADQDPRLSLIDHDQWFEVYEARDSSIWFGTTYEAVRFTNQVMPLAIGQRVYWFAEFDGRFFVLCETIHELGRDGTVAPLYTVRFSSDHWLPPRLINPVRTLRSVRTRRNYVLYCYGDRLILLKYANGTFTEVDQQPVAGGQLFTDSQQRVFVCAEAGGVQCFEQVGDKLVEQGDYFPNLKINKIFEDHQGTLWFCSFGEGAYALPRHYPVIFGAAEGMSSRQITALAVEHDSVLLAGDERGTVYEITSTLRRHQLYNPQSGFSRTRQILTLPSGERWVGVDRDIFYDNGRVVRRAFSEGSIKTLVARRDGMWYGSAIHLARITPGSLKIETIRRGRVTVLREDDAGNLWLGSTDGLYSEHDSFRTNWNRAFPLLKGRIAAIERGAPGQLWIATPGKGLLDATVRDGSITAVRELNATLPRPIRNVQAIFSEPEKDRLWLATNHGVYGLVHGEPVHYYSDSDGLAGNDVNTVLVHRDTLWAGTTLGLSRIVLNTPNDNFDFRTCITGLRYHLPGGEVFVNLLDSVPPGRWNELPPESSLFSLELTGLDFRRRGNLRYQCVITKLPPPFAWWTLSSLVAWIGAGFGPAVDTTWAQNDALRFGVQMAPGRYYVEVTAIGSNQQRSNATASWTVVKRPAWYQCLWVWLFFVGVIAVGAAMAVRTGMSNRLLNATVSELQLQALRAQINPHFIGNSINAIQQFFFPPDPVTASEYIALFNRLLRHTMQLSEQHFIAFEEELRYEHDYLQMIRLRFGARFDFTIEGTEDVPPDTPFPSMVLQPIIENATIHGLAADGKSRLLISFAWRGDRLVCSIVDNGIGLREAEARKHLATLERKSKGLELLQRKIQTLNKLFHLHMTIDLRDRGELDPSAHGTAVEVAFSPHRAPKVRRDGGSGTAPHQAPAGTNQNLSN